MENKNITKNDIEFYLLNREYSELSAKEMSIVKEHVSSEQEFNEMKAMLLGIDVFLKAEKELEPNPEIKTALLKEFSKQQPTGTYWLNGVFVSLFPKKKKLYQKPGMQLIGLAASVLLVVTVLLNSNNDLNNVELAQVEEVILEDKLIEPSKEIEQPEEVEMIVENEREEDSKDVAEKGVSSESFVVNMADEHNNELPGTGEALDNDLDMNKSNNQYFSRKELEKSETFEEEELVSEEANLVITSSTEPTVTTVEMDVLSNVSISETSGSSGKLSAKSKKDDLPKNSRSLAEDSDLIGILYTAM